MAIERIFMRLRDLHPHGETRRPGMYDREEERKNNSECVSGHSSRQGRETYTRAPGFAAGETEIGNGETRGSHTP